MVFSTWKVISVDRITKTQQNKRKTLQIHQHFIINRELAVRQLFSESSN